MARIKNNYTLPPESQWEFNRLMKLMKVERPSQLLEMMTHYVGAICRNGVDQSVIDASIRRQAEAKIEFRATK